MWIGFILSTLIFLVFSNLYIDSSDNVVIVDQHKLGLAFLILGTACAIFTAKNYLMERKMKWSYTMGEITSIDIVNSFLGQRKVVVNYTYTVDDRPHSNNMFDFTSREVKLSRLKFHRGFKSFSRVEDLHGDMIKVYYNSQKPWESAIARQGKISIMVTLLPSMALILYCGYSFAKAIIF